MTMNGYVNRTPQPSAFSLGFWTTKTCGLWASSRAGRRESDEQPYREWVEKNLQVVTEDGQQAKLCYNPIQERLNEVYDEARSRGGPIHIICLKARRHGVSTWWQSRIFERISRTPNQAAMVLAHDDPGSRTLYDISRRFYLGFPADTSPGLPPTWNESGMLLRYRPPHYSQLSVQTAHGHAGSAATIHMLHVSEVAKWTDARTTMLSLQQAARLADVLIESTANGQSGRGEYFYRLWQRAEAGESDYIPLFFPWFFNPEYALDEDGPACARWLDTALDDEEVALQEAHGLTLGQMAWRRYTISDLCGGVVDDFRQEYPATSDEAFLRVEGQRVFAPISLYRGKYIEAQGRNLHSPPAYGRLEWIDGHGPVLDMTGRCVNRQALRVEFVESGAEDGPLRIWHAPERYGPMSLHAYMGAADIAKGVQGGDSNSVAILDRVAGRVVAAWHELCDAGVFGDYLARLALFFGAEVAVEMDGVGTTAITKMLQLVGPEYVWAHHKLVPGAFHSETDFGRWGWKAMNRFEAVTGLQAVVREGDYEDPDDLAWAEIMQVVREPSGAPALSGMDRAACRCILAHIHRMTPLPHDPGREVRYALDYSGRQLERELARGPSMAQRAVHSIAKGVNPRAIRLPRGPKSRKKNGEW